MNKIPQSMLEWREKQPHGSIMSSGTFERIERDAYRRFRRKGVVPEEAKKRAKAVAGAAYWRAAMSQYERKNPPEEVEIYRNIIEIKAEKKDGKRYVHRFSPGSAIYGLPDGTLIIRSRHGKRLWDYF